MDPVAQATRLNNGTVVEGHDDWCCVQDMEAAGIVSGEPLEPGAVLHLSEAGTALVAELRKHKADGGTFANFKPAIDCH